MKGIKIVKNNSFVGRTREIQKLKDIDAQDSAQVIVVYGRRRIGKTELIEQFFAKKNIIKFEGLQPDLKKKISPIKDQQRQLDECVRRLAIYTQSHSLPQRIKNWSEFFEILIPYLGPSDVLYFEEVQWLASYQSEFFSRLKVFWDDRLRHLSKFRLVLCGSSPSFIVSELLSGQAFYNRSLNEIRLAPFDLDEIAQYFGPEYRAREIMLVALTLGGVCEYLKILKNAKVSFLNELALQSSAKDSFFKLEYDKIFVSSMANNKHYKKILFFLATKKFATKQEIAKFLKISAPGGTLSHLLDDLEKCELIKAYSPILNQNARNLVRYSIADEYINFYNKFILPKLADIDSGKFLQDANHFFDRHSLKINLGFMLEKWCRKNHRRLAKIMKFDQINYQSGAYFSRKSQAVKKGFQIDLMYIRDDNRIVLVEIKNHDELFDSQKVISEVLYKKNLFIKLHPKYKNFTFELALVSPEGISAKIKENLNFKHFITFEEIFAAAM